MCFKNTVKRLSPKLKAIAYKLKGRFCFFNEEDLYQEALVYLWRNFKSGTLEDKTDSYILQGCYFHLKNYIRKSIKRASFLSFDCRIGEEAVNLEEVIADSFDKSEYLDYLGDKLLAETIQNNGLNPREKQIISFYAQGLTTREIGGRLGISHVMVLKLTVRIRGKCQRYLDNI